jgi:hypothetical protein
MTGEARRGLNADPPRRRVRTVKQVYWSITHRCGCAPRSFRGWPCGGPCMTKGFVLRNDHSLVRCLHGAGQIVSKCESVGVSSPAPSRHRPGSRRGPGCCWSSGVGVVSAQHLSVGRAPRGLRCRLQQVDVVMSHFDSTTTHQLRLIGQRAALGGPRLDRRAGTIASRWRRYRLGRHWARKAAP